MRDCISSSLDEGKNVISRHNEQTTTAQGVGVRLLNVQEGTFEQAALGEVVKHAVASPEKPSIH